MRRDRRLRASRGPIAINASARGERPRRCPEAALGAPRPTVATTARRAGRDRSPMSGRRRARPIRGRARRARSRSLRTRAGSERSVHASRPERRALRARKRPCIPHGVCRDGIGEPSPYRASDDTNEPTLVVACARMRAARSARKPPHRERSARSMRRIKKEKMRRKSEYAVCGAQGSLHEIDGRRIVSIRRLRASPCAFDADASAISVPFALGETTKACVVSALKRTTRFCDCGRFSERARRPCAAMAQPRFASDADRRRRAKSDFSLDFSAFLTTTTARSATNERRLRAHRAHAVVRTMRRGRVRRRSVFAHAREPIRRFRAEIGAAASRMQATRRTRLSARRAGCRPRKPRAGPRWPRLPSCPAIRRSCWYVRPRTARCRRPWLRCGRWW